MTTREIRWTKAAKAIGGLAATLTLLAHFWLQSLPLTLIRVELLLFLIGVLLGLDIITENFPVSIGVETGSKNENEDNQHDGNSDSD